MNLFRSGMFGMTALLLAALAQASSVSNIFFADTEIEDPAQGITVEYQIFGSSPLAQQELSFYLSSDEDAYTGIKLTSFRVNFSCSGLPVPNCYPPAGTQTKFIAYSSMTQDARDYLNSVKNQCAPVTLYLVGGLAAFERTLSLNTASVGTVKLPDFLFESGTLEPTVASYDETLTIKYGLRSVCPSSTLPSVGVFLTDTSLQPLVYYGAVQALGPYGSSHTLSLNIGAPIVGDYGIALVADIFETVAESNEDNNIGVFSLTLTPPSSSATVSHINSLLNGGANIDFIDTTPEFHVIPNFNNTYMPVNKGMTDLNTKD
ncbi:hypothetical protein [Gynuella sp.]|uniref:hypothetical protein n=1 Tax=Gynuella sp. TaxID=2969146 RepID=UPI003D12F2AF